MTLPNTEYFDLIRLDCEDVKIGLSKECHNLANKIMNYIVLKLKKNNEE